MSRRQKYGQARRGLRAWPYEGCGRCRGRKQKRSLPAGGRRSGGAPEDRRRKLAALRPAPGEAGEKGQFSARSRGKVTRMRVPWPGALVS